MAVRGFNGSKNIGGALAKIRDRTRGFDKLEVRIGVQEGQQYEDGTEDGTPVAYVAAIHEYGAPKVGIPPRPFLRTTVAEKRKEWTGQMRDGVAAVMHGAASVDQALEMIGMGAAGDVKNTVSDLTEPPLAESTIRARFRKKGIADLSTSKRFEAEMLAGGGFGYAKPLVDTGLLLQSITSKVANKEGA